VTRSCDAGTRTKARNYRTAAARNDLLGFCRQLTIAAANADRIATDWLMPTMKMNHTSRCRMIVQAHMMMNAMPMMVVPRCCVTRLSYESDPSKQNRKKYENGCTPIHNNSIPDLPYYRQWKHYFKQGQKETLASGCGIPPMRLLKKFALAIRGRPRVTPCVQAAPLLWSNGAMMGFASDTFFCKPWVSKCSACAAPHDQGDRPKTLYTDRPRRRRT
jgi:hypothetical protein